VVTGKGGTLFHLFLDNDILKPREGQTPTTDSSMTHGFRAITFTFTHLADVHSFSDLQLLYMSEVARL